MLDPCPSWLATAMTPPHSSSRVIIHDAFFKREVNLTATRAVLDGDFRLNAERTIQP
jgi:hypothetical protein